MYCRYCGQKIEDDSLFCNKCGKSLGGIVSSSPQKALRRVDEQSFLNRDVMVTYLYQLRVMEFSVSKLSQDLNQLDRQISQLGISRSISKPFQDSVEISMVAFPFFFGIALTVVGAFLYNLIPWGLFSLAKAIGIIAIVGSILYGLFSATSKSNANEERRQEYDRAVQADQERVQKELQQKQSLVRKRPEYASRLDKAVNLREKIYSVNIIPKQMRNIWAIYYLYDYLSTSRSTLESAMLHFDLNEIKAKLDTVIMQQQQIILLQAQQNAHSKTIIAQNEELIERAIASEHNTERIAQYAEIATANSEVTAFTNAVMASIMVSKY